MGGVASHEMLNFGSILQAGPVRQDNMSPTSCDAEARFQLLKVRPPELDIVVSAQACRQKVRGKRGK